MAGTTSLLSPVSLLEEILLLDCGDILTLVWISHQELEQQMSKTGLTLLNIDYPVGVDPISYTKDFLFKNQDKLLDSRGDVLFSINYENIWDLHDNPKIQEINNYLISFMTDLQGWLVDTSAWYPVRIGRNVYKLILMPIENMKIENNWNFFVENTYVIFADNQYSLKNI